MTRITDIVNKEVANLSTCDQEPIHIPGSIQENGCLLAVERKNGTIEFCSDNSGDFIGYHPAQVLGKSIRLVFTPDFVRQIETFPTENSSFFADPIPVHIHDKQFLVRIHQTESYHILEFEESFPGDINTASLYQHFFSFSRRIQEMGSMKDLCQFVAEEIRKQTGYDRVMIYRFDKEYNGEIFAEAKEESLEPFLGLHYPHTDIPVQARKLYIRNPLRIITDINYTPVPVMTLNDGKRSAADLDLSLSILRSTSPIHIEYLKNMGVGATLTISLLKNDDLWGLIACHHYSAKKLPHHIRNVSLLQGSFLASQINLRETEEYYTLNNGIQAKMQQLMTALYGKHKDLAEGIIESPALPEIANAQSVVIISKGHIYKQGPLPSDEELIALAAFLSERAENGKLVTERLPELYEPAKAYAEQVSGVAYFQTSMASPDCIIWCRPEMQKLVNWGGQPEKPESRHARLSPRKSFELWKEKVRYRSPDWHEAEVNAAATFMVALEKQFYARYLVEEEEKQRQLGIQLSKANEELENINWISTHDLKEPLRKIQVFSSMLLNKDAKNLSEQVTTALNRINASAAKMQLLIEDIMLYANVRSSKPDFVEVDLNTVMEEIMDDFGEEISERKAALTTTRLPVILGIRFQIKQLFLNLLSNALKFSQEGKTNTITISHEVTERADPFSAVPGRLNAYHLIRFRDAGIGFEEKYAKRIFEVFQRLHTSTEIRGTGIGLAICKKIMDTHQGFIEASGQPGEGAVFSVFFPIHPVE